MLVQEHHRSVVEEVIGSETIATRSERPSSLCQELPRLKVHWYIFNYCLYTDYPKYVQQANCVILDLWRPDNSLTTMVR